MEIKPTTFLLMTPYQQCKIADRFSSIFKVAPTNLQITCISLPANLDAQLNNLSKAKAIEQTPECLEVDEEYRQRLIESQATSVSRRFFISFEYERRNVGFKKPSIDDIVYSLNKTALMIESTLRDCGNEVVREDSSNPNYFASEILYRILSRHGDSFDNHLEKVINQYFDYYKSDRFYVPPVDYICPDTISFMNRRYVVVDGMYYTYYYIPSDGYSSPTFAGWLATFINSYADVDVNIYYRKVPSQEVLGSLRRNITFSEADLDGASLASQTKDSSEATLSSSIYLKNGIMMGDDFYYINTLITIGGQSPEIVDDKVDDIVQIANQRGIKLYPCTFDEEKAFISSLPLCKLEQSLFDISKRNCLLSDLACTYPFTAYEINDPNGIYYGDDEQTGSLAIIDLFNKERFKNPNVFVTGTSGSGKTYSISLLAIRHRILHIPVIIIAPEKQHEFKRLCNALGGQFIELAPGSPNRINIMEILKPDFSALETNSLIDGSDFSSSYLTEKISNLKDFFQLKITDMNIEEEQLLDVALVQTYKKFGITEDNNSLFDSEDETRTRYRKMPIISDLIAEMKKIPRLARMVNIMNYFVTGSGNSFNGETNVDLNNDFIVIGLEKMKGNLLNQGMYMAMDFAWSKIKEDRTKNNVLIFDEWWSLANQAKSAEYSMKIAKTIRAYGGSLIIATQQLKDILAVDNGKYGEAVLANCQTKILLGMNEEDADNVQSMLNLTELERDQITRFKQGSALLLAGDSKVQIKFVASAMEHALITTNSEDLLRIANERKKAIEKIENKEQEQYIDIYDDSIYTFMLDDEDYRLRYINPSLYGKSEQERGADTDEEES